MDKTEKKIKRMKCHNRDIAIKQEFHQQCLDMEKLSEDIVAFNENGSRCAIIYDNQNPIRKYYVIVLQKEEIQPASQFSNKTLWQVIRFRTITETEDAIDAMCYANMILRMV